jgi:hypothetical protein
MGLYCGRCGDAVLAADREGRTRIAVVWGIARGPWLFDPWGQRCSIDLCAECMIDLAGFLADSPMHRAEARPVDDQVGDDAGARELVQRPARPGPPRPERWAAAAHPAASSAPRAVPRAVRLANNGVG